MKEMGGYTDAALRRLPIMVGSGEAALGRARAIQALLDYPEERRKSDHHKLDSITDVLNKALDRGEWKVPGENDRTSRTLPWAKEIKTSTMRDFLRQYSDLTVYNVQAEEADWPMLARLLEERGLAPAFVAAISPNRSADSRKRPLAIMKEEADEDDDEGDGKSKGKDAAEG